MARSGEWTPDALLAYLDRWGVHLSTLDLTNEVTATTPEGRRYVGQLGRLRQLARHIIKQEGTPTDGTRRQAPQDARR